MVKSSNKEFNKHDYVCHECQYSTNNKAAYSSHCKTKKHLKTVEDQKEKPKSSFSELEKELMSKIKSNKQENVKFDPVKFMKDKGFNSEMFNPDQDDYDDYDEDEYFRDDQPQETNNEYNYTVNTNVPFGANFEQELINQIKDQLDRIGNNNANPNYRVDLMETDYKKEHVITGLFDIDYLQIHPEQEIAFEDFKYKYRNLEPVLRDAIFQDVKILLAFNCPPCE